MLYIMMWNMVVDSLWAQILDEVIHIYYFFFFCDILNVYLGL